jgi:predicted phosphodiesterase
MPHLEQFRDPDLSLWQSAVDEVVAKRTGTARAESVGEAPVIQRPDNSDQMVQGAIIDLAAENSNHPLQAPEITGPAVTEGVGGFAQFCSNVARQLAWAKIKGDAAQVAACQAQFAKFGQCDPGWLEVADKFAEFQLQIKLQGGRVPYRIYSSIDDFVIDGKLPANAKIGIVGDWGTGDNSAKQVLAQMARKKPDVVIHLGDIYYSCTDFEAQNYFLQIWKNSFDPAIIPSFTLSGNHDMFGGGGPYYSLIDQLKQPASYCCLRNDNWQFIMIDTGLHDRTPGGSDPTFLEDSEAAWVKRRIAAAEERKTVLLSHHQLFTRYSNIVDPPPAGQGGMAVNPKLQQQLGDILPQVALWIWGHEHDFVVYEKQLNVLARCLGHGAFPVLTSDAPQVQHPEIAANDAVRPAENDNFFTHGYAIMELSGGNATVSYYQDIEEDDAMWVDNI